MRISQAIGLIVATAAINTAGAGGLPAAGTLKCKSEGRHRIAKQGGAEVYLISKTSCMLSSDQPGSMVLNYVTHVALDLGVSTGTLLTGSGHVIDNGSPVSAFQFQDGAWALKVADGKLTGWSAQGSSQFLAGQYRGKTMRWTAKPISPVEMHVEYKIE